MCLRERVVDLVRREFARLGLFVPPDADLVRGARENVGIAVAVEIVHVHLRGRFRRAWLRELPFGGRILVGRRFPQPLGVTTSLRPSPLMSPRPMPVIKLAGHVDALGRNGGDAHLAIGSLSRRAMPTYFCGPSASFGSVRCPSAFPSCRRRRRRNTRGSRCSSRRRRRSAPTGEPSLSGSRARPSLGPGIRRRADRPAVAVEIFRPSLKALAVLERIEIARLFAHGVQLPVGSGVKAFAGGDIELAVMIEIADGYAFAAKLRVECVFLNEISSANAAGAKTEARAKARSVRVTKTVPRSKSVRMRHVASDAPA